MSWDIFPKDKVEYFLDKLKDIFDTKVDKVAGKGLSTNDYTTTEKNKLAGIESGAQVNPTIDSALSGSSTNAVQNKVVKSALDGKADSVEVEGLKTATGNPITLTDGSDTYAQGLSVKLEPKQDLHGQSAPYVGGVGKNKLPMTVAGLKSINSSTGTWSGNVFTREGCTFEVLTDSDNNVVGIKVNAPSSHNTATFSFGDFTRISGTTYILNGCPANGTTASYKLRWNDVGYDYGNGITTDGTAGTGTVAIDIMSNTAVTNLIFYPMIRLATETDPTFAPYSNICHISGYEGVEVEDVGKNFIGKGIRLDGYINAALMKFMAMANCVGYYFETADLPDKITFNAVNGNRAYYGYFNTVPQDDADCLYENQTQQALPNSITVDKSYKYIHLQFSYMQAVSNVQVEEGNQSTTYEPYKSRTASVTFGQTVYGAIINLLTGECVVDSRKKTISELSFTRETPSGRVRYIASISEMEKKTVRTMENLYSDRYETISDGRSYANCPDYCIFNRPEGGIYINDQRYSSVEDFVTANGDSVIVYPLAEPFTIQLTPQELKLLQDTNNLTTNGTTITLDYIPNNSIGDAVKASEEYTDRAVEAVEKLMPQKTVLYDDVIDVGDDLYLSIPSSFNYIIFELTISSASYYGTGSLMVTSWDDTLNILTTSHESELRTCVLLPIRDRVEVSGDFFNEHGELKITAF